MSLNRITDIIIIGAGITGCAVARELSRYDVDILVVEAGSDVAEGATKANSGIIHAGYDAVPGTQKARYNIAGAELYPDLCEQIGVAYHQCGALVLAFDEEDRKMIETLFERGRQNGVKDLRILENEEALSLEPNINPAIVCALYVPTSAIVSPYEVAYALADDAARNGVSFAFEEKVISVAQDRENAFRVKTSKHEYTCKVLINCAGSSGADIHNQLSDTRLSMVHRRGQYYLLDRAEKQPFTRTIFQCPSDMGKGVLISPTVHGNLLIGPTAEDIEAPFDTATTYQGLSEVLETAKRTWPQLSVRTNITNFSGVRAHLEKDDFIIGEVEGVSGAFEAIGIESPGLSSAPAIAAELGKMVVNYLGLRQKETIRKNPVKKKNFHDMSEHEREQAWKENPLYGNIVCRCEMVTEAEIREAVNRPVGAKSIDAVKRRTRAGMGRCQGGFCSPRVAAIIAEETGISLQDVTKNGGYGNLLMGTIEQFLKGDEADE